MADISYIPVVGTVRGVRSMPEDCCSKLVTIMTPEEEVNFIVSPDTAVIDSTPLRIGMRVAAFYDPSAPAPLVYPPQYRAILVTRLERGENVMLSDFYGPDLISAQNTLQLNVDGSVRVTTVNGQRYNCSLENRQLLVYYSATTRSVPPQTTPRRLVVIC